MGSSNLIYFYQTKVPNQYFIYWICLAFTYDSIILKTARKRKTLSRSTLIPLQHWTYVCNQTLGKWSYISASINTKNMRFTCMCFPRKVFPNVCLITKPELSFNRLTYVLPVLQALPCHLSYFLFFFFFMGVLTRNLTCAWWKHVNMTKWCLFASY